MANPPAELPPLPIEAADLPPLNDVVVEAVCQEHRRSLLRLAGRLPSWRWTAEPGDVRGRTPALEVARPRRGRRAHSA